MPPADHLTACAVVAGINMLAALVTDQFESRRAGYIEPAMNLLNSGGVAAGGV